MGITAAMVIRAWALREPARSAVLLPDEEKSVSYGELDLRARRVAYALHKAGVRPGDRVALTVPNGIRFLDGYFGGLYAGCTLLPIPPMSAPPELASRLAHAHCTALISSEATRLLSETALAQARGASSLNIDELVAADDAIDAPHDCAPSDLAMILYTSGTTGSAKGAMITHASLATHTAALVHHVLALREHDRVLAVLPLTHSYGIRMTLLAPFYAGAQTVLLERFRAERTLAVLRDERITWFAGVPTMFFALAQTARDDESLEESTLRWCLSAGAPLPREVRLRAEARLGAKVRQGFGLTEATFSTIADPDDDGAEDSVGRPVFGVEVRIVDEQDAVLPPETPGEVCIRGQNVMAGYLDDGEATADAMRGGWLHSGDIGVLDRAGRLTVVDRLKDMVIRGGFNVYPAEVEAVLVAHPSIENAVVVGVPDPRYGEEVLAAVVLRSERTLDLVQLDAFCRERLSRVKTPRAVAIMDVLPVGASGKVLRREVRRLALAGELEIKPLPKS